MLPPRALPTAHFDRNNIPATSGTGHLEGVSHEWREDKSHPSLSGTGSTNVAPRRAANSPRQQTLGGAVSAYRRADVWRIMLFNFRVF